MKRDPYNDYNRLPMEKAFNVRELGGYAARKGKITCYHEFLRSDSLYGITKEDEEFLLDYGVEAVIDLRGEPEAVRCPNPLAGYEEVDYINLPFITDNVLDMREVRDQGFDPCKFYVNLTEYKEMVAQIMRFIIDHRDGCVLFHCTAGKDRTGVVAMILLGICGVSKEDIMANYEVSFSYLDKHVTVNYGEGLEDLNNSKREWIAAAYDNIMDNYGSFKNYLLECGLTKKEIRRIRKKLL